MGRPGKVLEAIQGFFAPPNDARPDSVYLEDRALNVDVYGAGTESSDALTVRRLDPANNAPTTLFQVLKNGTIKVAGVLMTAFSGSHADLTSVTANQHHNQAHAINGADHTGTLDDAQIPASIARDSELTTHESDTSTHGVGEVVGRTEVQTLTNKTLTAPTIADFTNAAHDHGDADDGGGLVSGITLTQPTIADFTNAQHDHGDADDGGLVTAPACRAYHNTGQNVANVTWTALTFNSERYDTDTIHDTGTNPTRLTCKTAGKYRIWANCAFEANAAGAQRDIRLRLNGAGGNYIGRVSSSKHNDEFGLHISTTYELAVNDYVEVMVYQDSGSTITVSGNAAYGAEFGMERVG